MHDDLHAVLPQAYAPHALGTSLHLPAPSQKLAWVSVAPAQAFALQVAVTGGKVHAIGSLPLHTLPHSVPAPVPPHAARVPRGAPETVLHVPTEPLSAQA